MGGSRLQAHNATTGPFSGQPQRLHFQPLIYPDDQLASPTPNDSDEPCPVHNSTLLDDHSHYSITVDLPPLFMHPYDLIYPDIAHKVTSDKNEIVGDDTVGIDITEGVPRCERLLCSDDWNNLET